MSIAGQTIEGYKIQKPIGEGKFSTVYKAEAGDGTIVAVKKIKIFDMMDPKQRDKCLKEVQLMQPLDHPNIIKYLSSFIWSNELIIVTEWAEKGDLKRLIKNAQQEDTPFEEIRVWDYISQISSALKHMHEKRIMHRDLKPANIFISQQDTQLKYNISVSLKIGDLGLGRIFSSETIEAYSKVGTPLYMSPELLHGEGYDMRSDVWSLGCIAYELCEFKSPFRNENEKMSLMDLFNNITKGEFKQIQNRYSQELREIINSMIVVDPTKRADSATINDKSLSVLQILNEQRKSPKIYCILVMEDIYEKLALVQYHQYFCSVLKKPPVSKFYFATDSKSNSQENEQKFFYFAELCFWLMSLPKHDKRNKNAAALSVKQSVKYHSIDETAMTLLEDIKNWGIRLPEELNYVHINSGCGDTVCFILNDLLNRELIRLNFKFETPQFGEIIKTDEKKEQEYIEIGDQVDEEEAELSDDSLSIEQDFLTQSILIYNKKFNVDEMNLNNQISDEKAMIDAKIPLDEWQIELTRVDKELTRFEINLKVNGKEQLLKDYEKTQNHLRKSKKLLTKSRDFFKSEKVQEIQYEWTEFLDRIPKMEQRLTEQIPPEMKEKLRENKEELQQLKEKYSRVQQNITALQVQESSLNAELEKKRSLLGSNQDDSTDKRQKLIDLIQQLKSEIRELNVKNGLKQIELLREIKKNQTFNEDDLDRSSDLSEI